MIIGPTKYKMVDSISIYP